MHHLTQRGWVPFGFNSQWNAHLTAPCAAWWSRNRYSVLFSFSNTFVLDDGAACGFKGEKSLHVFSAAELCRGGAAAMLTPSERELENRLSAFLVQGAVLFPMKKNKATHWLCDDEGWAGNYGWEKESKAFSPSIYLIFPALHMVVIYKQTSPGAVGQKQTVFWDGFLQQPIIEVSFLEVKNAVKWDSVNKWKMCNTQVPLSGEEVWEASKGKWDSLLKTEAAV